jgi:hypothetical protein
LKEAVSLYKNLVLFLLIGLGCTLLLTERVSARIFPCQPGNFTTIGNATLDPITYKLQLTPYDYYQKGGVCSNNSAILSQPFDFSAQVYLSPINETVADGLCCIGHNSNPEYNFKAYINGNEWHKSTSPVILPVLINNNKYF